MILAFPLLCLHIEIAIDAIIEGYNKSTGRNCKYLSEIAQLERSNDHTVSMCRSDGKYVADVRNVHAHVLRSDSDWEDAMNALRKRVNAVTFDFAATLQMKYLKRRE